MIMNSIKVLIVISTFINLLGFCSICSADHSNDVLNSLRELKHRKFYEKRSKYSQERFGDLELVIATQKNKTDTMESLKNQGFALIRSKIKPASSCQIHAEKVNMPNLPRRSQDGSGYCYGYVTLALVQQLYCEEKKGGCHFNQDKDDRLSVLDAIVQGHPESILKTGGNTHKILKGLSGKAIAKESECPVPWGDGGFGVFHNTYKWLSKTVTGMTEAKFCFECNEKSKLDAMNFKPESKNKEDTEKSSDPSKKLLVFITNTSSYISKLIFDKPLYPRYCKQTEKLPEFDVHFDSRKLKPNQKNSIDEQLNKGRLVYFLLNPFEFRLPTLHAAVIQGKRIICCEGSCKTQYKIQDSARFYKVWGYKDSWVDSDEIFSRSLIGVGWIEKKQK